MGEEYKYKELTGKIIGCAMQVHSEIGCGFQEVIYGRCLAVELDELGISYQREIEMPILYKGKDVGTRRVDFLIEDKVLVELKAISAIDDSHIAQTINYLEVFNLEVGLLINFGETSLKFKRFVKSARSVPLKSS